MVVFLQFSDELLTDLADCFRVQMLTYLSFYITMITLFSNNLLSCNHNKRVCQQNISKCFSNYC